MRPTKFNFGSALLVLVLLAIAILAAACGDDDSDEPTATAGDGSPTGTEEASPIEAETLRYGISGRVGLYWYIYIGQEEGIYDKHGVDLQLVETQTGSNADILQLVAAGEADVGSMTGDPVFAARQQGVGDFVITNSVVSPVIWALVTQPEINSLEELRGRTIASSSPVSGPTLAARVIMRDAGVQDDEYDILVLGGGSSGRLAALVNGEVDAALQSQPANFEAIDQGLKILAYSNEVADFYDIVDVTTPSFLNSNCELMSRFNAAQAEIGEWFDDTANQQRAIDILIGAIGTDASIAERTYDLYQEALTFGYTDPTEHAGEMIEVLESVGELNAGAVAVEDVVSTECAPE